MKYEALKFFAAIFLVGVSAFPVDDYNWTELEHDFIDFFHLMPVEKMLKVVEDHMNDPELISAVNYLKDEEFHNLVYAVEELPQFHKFVLYLEEAGYSIVKELKLLHEIYLMKPYLPPKASSQRFIREAGQGGMAGYVKDMIAILPKKEIHELHEKKLKESPAFAKYSAYLRSDKYAQIVQDLMVQKPFVQFLEKSSEHGLEIMSFWEFKMYFFGFK